MKKTFCLYATLILTCWGLGGFELYSQEVPPGVQEFNTQYAALKTQGEEIQRWQKEYPTATPERQKEIQREGSAKTQQIRRLYESLIPVALKAFVESDGTHRDLNMFVMDYAILCLERDDYENAYQTISMLLKKGLQKEHPELLEMAGTASFMLNQFAVAQNCYDIAKRAGKLSQRGAMFASMIPYYKEAWEEEKKIRAAEAQANDLPIVLMRTTAGDMELLLYENEAPNTVANFISLAEKGFYNNLTFHRVLPGFMAQGGCPKGDGTGGPGYAIPCETKKPGARKHFRGTLSMAHAGPDTGGSQFFITFIPTQSLDGVHTAFGRVVKGMEVLSKIERIDPEQPYPGQVPTKIIEMKVIRKRDHAYQPTTLADPRG